MGEEGSRGERIKMGEGKREREKGRGERGGKKGEGEGGG